jgi:hypothetical protein
MSIKNKTSYYAINTVFKYYYYYNCIKIINKNVNLIQIYIYWNKMSVYEPRSKY